MDFADLDNDGHLDLVAVGQHGGLLVAIGQGDGRFSSQGVYAEGSGMRDVSVGDVDRDGLVDAVAASEGYIRVFLNEEVPDPPTPTPTPSSTPVSPSPDPSPTPTEPPLGPPRFLTAVGGNGEITLAWQEPEVGNPSEYIIYIQGVDGSLSELDRTTSSRLHYTDRGLGADIQRTYRVAARSGSTSSLMSEIATATTFGRAASPRAVRASPGSEIGSIVVSWEAPASSGGTSVLGYRLCRSTRFGERGFCADVGDTFVYTDSDNRLLTDYYYSVSALTVVGEGMPSGQDCSHAFPELTIVSC